jgi:hypothetical protein
MTTPHAFADYLNAQAAGFETIANACAVYVGVQSGALTPEDMYNSLIYNARSAADVDQMLYQLEGDRSYTEHAALLVLSAAWNDPAQSEAIQQAFANAASVDEIDLHDLAITVLYGMYLLARSGGAGLREVVYRQADGQIVAASLDSPISSAALFEAMRDQYATPG